MMFREKKTSSRKKERIVRPVRTSKHQDSSFYRPVGTGQGKSSFR